MGKLKLLKKGIDVIKGTSKKKGVASDSLNIVNRKYQGRYFFERAKTKKTDEKRVRAAKSFAKSHPDPSAKWGISKTPHKDRLIMKIKLTPREAGVGRRLFEKFAPKQYPYSPPSKRQGRLGRIIVPKSALKRQKVDRKLTREVRKEKKRGGMINYYQDLL